MKKHKIFWFVAVILASITWGCVQELNPDTGQVETLMNPGVATQIDVVAEAAPGIAGLLAVFFPALFPVVGIVAGAAGAWAKMRPKVIVARTEADMYYAATESIVDAIEQWKAAGPEAWISLKAKLGDNVGDNTEAVIRAFRGLPLKD